MSDPISADRLDSRLTDLCRLVAQRRPAETEIVSRCETVKETAGSEYRKAEKELTEQSEANRARTEEEYASLRRRIVAQFESDHQAAESEYRKVRAGIVARFDADQRSAEEARKETSWEASTVSEAVEGGAAVGLKEANRRIASQWREVAAIRREAEELLRRRRQWRKFPQQQLSATPQDDPVRQFAELVVRARAELRALGVEAISRLFEGAQPVAFFLLFCTAIVLPTALAVGPAGWRWIAASAAGATVLYVLLGGWLYLVARRQSRKAYLALRQTLAEAEALHPRALEAITAYYQGRIATAGQRCNSQVHEADDTFQRTTADLQARKQHLLEQTDREHKAALEEITARRDRELQEVDDVYPRRLRELDQGYRAEKQKLEGEHAQRLQENEQRFQREWNEMADRWRSGVGRFRATVEQARQWCHQRFPDWNTADWQRWVPAAEIPPVFGFGHYDVSLRQIEGGIPEDPRLHPPQTEFEMPALLPFPQRSLLLLKAAGTGRSRAVELLQAVTLRMLTGIPPGKVRFTIIDPVGLGENFSAFMHLADYDEQLITSRIWTDAAHIEQRLANLTEHMENVIQVYLRNEFDTIQQYNDFAGEMAEAYRVLVIANFPANFTENAAARLKSIVASGARCGVFTLLSVDTKLPLPRHFDLADLVPHSLCLRWREGRAERKHPEYGTLPLRFARPPDAEQFTGMVRAVGSCVEDVARVEVPFECVVPEPSQWWTADSREGIDVPLGRAGAKKLQHLNLGKGTSHHVLISGKTGSGKSTLLHALITTLALRYSPDEVELYLVDFKKGVEFKAYGGRRLPHARVVAIESEREFGLSVLARLDEELKNRGDSFRHLRVQDLKGFREARPQARLPRILLIIDEFQELFVEDDRIAQDAALYLDRLVRQGRAFGIHVLLGSQTLSGAYSLARSTIGQMAVRIALQCSEGDAHLILSEENTAARLLTRPGEAIYNDANGLYEGNHPFQVVWLPDHQRDEYLERICQLAAQRELHVPAPIVFEGNAPADPAENPTLAELLRAAAWPEASSATQAWLGAPVAIKHPTAAAFVRQSGSNLLVIGHREEAAEGVLATCLISLAAQHPPAGSGEGSLGARFYVFDGMRPDAPDAGFWKRLASVVPHEVAVVPPRGTAAAIAEIAAELARREQADQGDAPPVYLIVHNLGRFRDLRKADDDFGFSRLDDDKPASPARQFADLLRNGPERGIHSLLWCDTYNSASRSLDRQGLRDIEIRVLFQMNAADSSNLIDSPAASRLGVHRAILSDEAQGHLEKFRPYGLPSDEWLARVKEQLHRRATNRPVNLPDQP